MISPRFFISLLLVFRFAGALAAQSIVSPEVAPDGRVTFRLAAPKAGEVELRCESLPPTPMVKGADGVWSVTVGPLEPDFYSYFLMADGMRLIDPRNPLLKYNLITNESIAHVPGPKSLPWEINDVPRGRVHRHYYHSKVGGDDRDFLVYTPPGYDEAAGTDYPVLYLLHGFSDDATAWSTVGRAHIMMDNLLAREQAVPMIIVMPFGYGHPEVTRNDWDHLPRGEMGRNTVDFVPTLLDEVMPQVEAAYRVSRRQSDTAIAGLSMGGAEARLVGLTHPDRFAYVGVFSAGGNRASFDQSFSKVGQSINDQLRLLWIACGRDDKGALAGSEEFAAWLSARGVKHTLHVSDGAHTFRVWRSYFLQFVPQLFTKR